MRVSGADDIGPGSMDFRVNCKRSFGSVSGKSCLCVVSNVKGRHTMIEETIPSAVDHLAGMIDENQIIGGNQREM